MQKDLSYFRFVNVVAAELAAASAKATEVADLHQFSGLMLGVAVSMSDDPEETQKRLVPQILCYKAAAEALRDAASKLDLAADMYNQHLKTPLPLDAGLAGASAAAAEQISEEAILTFLEDMKPAVQALLDAGRKTSKEWEKKAEQQWEEFKNQSSPEGDQAEQPEPAAVE